MNKLYAKVVHFLKPKLTFLLMLVATSLGAPILVNVFSGSGVLGENFYKMVGISSDKHPSNIQPIPSMIIHVEVFGSQEKTFLDNATVSLRRKSGSAQPLYQGNNQPLFDKKIEGYIFSDLNATPGEEVIISAHAIGYRGSDKVATIGTPTTISLKKIFE